MRYKNRLAIFLLSVCLLTACPAPEFDHVIINESKTILDVEYEYFSGSIQEGHWKLTDPAKINVEQYGDGGDETKWTNLTAENEYQSETTGEESAAADSNAGQSKKPGVRKVKLKLFPGEVLRVFRSSHINMDLKNLKSIKLSGENGKFEIEGKGFEQFSDYRPDRFFTDTNDYRVVYR